MSAYPAIWRGPRPAVGPAIWRTPGEVVLIEPGVLRSPFALTRAQADGARSTALGSDGATWAEYAADVARFHGVSQRLRIEGQRTDSIRNPRGEGGSAGVPGVRPTNWLGSATWNGIAFGSEGGLPYVEIRFVPAGAGEQGMNLELANLIVAADGQPWAGRCFVSLAGGSTANLTNCLLRIRRGTAAGGFRGNIDGAPFSPTTGALGSRDYRVAGAISDALTDRVTLGLIYTTTGAADFTLRLAGAQLEQAAFSSSPILPPVGTPGASTRGADLLSASLTNLGLSGRFAVRGRFMLPQAAPSGADQLLFQVDDGTDNNRFRIRNLAGGNTIVAGRVTGGSAVDATSLGSMTPGREFEVLMVLDGLGGMAASLNGGTMRGVSGGPTSPTTLRVGSNAAGAMNLFGEVGLLAVAQL